MSKINFEEMESNTSNSDEIETFHMDVSHVARDGAVSLHTLDCDAKAEPNAIKDFFPVNTGLFLYLQEKNTDCNAINTFYLY